MMKSFAAFFSNLLVWVKPFMLILALVAVIAILALLSYRLLARLYRSQRNDMAAIRWLKIQNQGNTAGIFLLRLDPGLGKVNVQLYHGGKQLENASLPELQASPPPEVEEAASVLPQANPAQRPAVTTSSKPAPPAKGPGTGEMVKQKANGVIGVGRTLAGVLGAIGSLLPGQLGEGFKSQAAQIQATTQTASQAVTEPEQKKRELDFVRDGIKNLSGQKNTEKAPQPAGPARPGATETIQGEAVGTSPAAKIPPASGRPQAAKTAILQKDLFQTPAVQPGESILIDLVCSPLNIYRGARFSLQIQCSQLQADNPQAAPAHSQTSVLREFDIQGLKVPQAALNLSISMLVVATNIVIAILLVRLLVGLI